MNLSKLFETQAALDARIYESHPELKGQDNLDWKVLALQVELGECANEWRGFKKWSHDQEPRNHVHVGMCIYCGGSGEDETEEDEFLECHFCDGAGDEYCNPLLEEYVDCLHFFLSIGIEKLGLTSFNFEPFKVNGGIIQQFLSLNKHIGNMQFAYKVDEASSFETKNFYDNYVFSLSMFLGLGEMFGFTGEQIEQAYYAKNKINHQRQEAQY